MSLYKKCIKNRSQCAVSFPLIHVTQIIVVDSPDSPEKKAKAFTHLQTHTHLFDRPKQPAVAVDHQQHRETQAESEEADDVGVRLGRLDRPRHGAACPCPLYSVAAPAQQRRNRPEQRVQPRGPDSQQGLAVVGPVLVVHGQSAVAVVRQDHQRNQ